MSRKVSTKLPFYAVYNHKIAQILSKMADVVHVTAQIRGIVRSQRRIVLSKVYYTGSEVPKLSTHTHTHTHTHTFLYSFLHMRGAFKF